jgi:large conductance mechanosensitive channel
MKIAKEFRDFAIRGNVIDLAVGVVIGAAFGKIVTSLVGDIIMPAVGQLVGGIDLSRYKLVLKEAVDDKGEVAVRFGQFAQNVFDFLIIAFAIFIVVRLLNAAKRKHEAAPATAAAPPPEEILLLREIRDELRQR